jgi:hypothetical protein
MRTLTLLLCVPLTLVSLDCQRAQEVGAYNTEGKDIRRGPTVA